MTERATERATERETERATERDRESNREQQRERDRESDREMRHSHIVPKNLYRAITPFLVNFFLTRDFIKNQKFVQSLFKLCSKFVRTCSNKLRTKCSETFLGETFPGETLKKVRIFLLDFLSTFLKPLKFTKYW